jgi:hypothetical protein
MGCVDTTPPSCNLTLGPTPYDRAVTAPACPSLCARTASASEVAIPLYDSLAPDCGPAADCDATIREATRCL